MKVKISQNKLDDIVENNCSDSDQSWWIQGLIEDSLDELLEIINDQLFEKDQIEIVPEEKYIKCDCTFIKKYSSTKNRDVFDHVTYCEEHEDERPWSTQDHINNCSECKMENK